MRNPEKHLSRQHAWISGLIRHSPFGICHSLSCLFLLFAVSAMAAPATSQPRPNIIFILMDDLRWDEMDYPFVKVPNIKRIERDGVKFVNAFVTTPLCSPSRA